jgi:hypothetical protein
MTKASDCFCACGKPAVCYWPCIDPDIPSHPYCRECVDKAQVSLLLKLQEIGREKDAK